MQLVIGDTVTKNNPRNVFVVYADFMHGDADDYSEEKVGAFPVESKTNDAGSIEELITVLQQMKMAKVNGHRNDIIYTYRATIPGFDKFFENFEWPYDIFSDYNYKAAFDGFHVRYFDAAGLEYKVTVTPDG